MNRLNEEIERERQFRKLQEDEVVKLREQLAETMRSFKIMEDKYQVLKHFEFVWIFWNF